MSDNVIFNTLNVFWDSPLEKMVSPEVAERIKSAVAKFCKRHKARISDIAIGPVNGELVVTCILRDMDNKEEIREGIYYAYSYCVDNPEKSYFDHIVIRKIMEGFVYRPFEDVNFVEIGHEK